MPSQQNTLPIDPLVNNFENFNSHLGSANDGFKDLLSQIGNLNSGIKNLDKSIGSNTTNIGRNLNNITAETRQLTTAARPQSVASRPTRPQRQQLALPDMGDMFGSGFMHPNMSEQYNKQANSAKPKTLMGGVGKSYGSDFNKNLLQMGHSMNPMSFLQYSMMFGASFPVQMKMAENFTRPVTDVNEKFEGLKTFGSGFMGIGDAMKGFSQQMQSPFKMYENIYQSKIMLSSALGGDKQSNKAMDNAMKMAREYPVKTEQVLSSLTRLAVYPEVKPHLQNEGFQKQLMETVSGMSLIVPEQGMEGAMFSLVEAMSGSLRSLQMRFNVSPEVVQSLSGMSKGEMSSDPTKLIKGLHTFVSKAVGLDVLEKQKYTFSKQVDNFGDSLQMMTRSVFENTGLYKSATGAATAFQTGFSTLSSNKEFLGMVGSIMQPYQSRMDKSIAKFAGIDVGTYKSSPMSYTMAAMEKNFEGMSLDEIGQKFDVLVDDFGGILRDTSNKINSVIESKFGDTLGAIGGDIASVVGKSFHNMTAGVLRGFGSTLMENPMDILAPIGMMAMPLMAVLGGIQLIPTMLQTAIERGSLGQITGKVGNLLLGKQNTAIGDAATSSFQSAIKKGKPITNLAHLSQAERTAKESYSTLTKGNYNKYIGQHLGELNNAVKSDKKGISNIIDNDLSGRITNRFGKLADGQDPKLRGTNKGLTRKADVNRITGDIATTGYSKLNTKQREMFDNSIVRLKNAGLDDSQINKMKRSFMDSIINSVESSNDLKGYGTKLRDSDSVKIGREFLGSQYDYNISSKETDMVNSLRKNRPDLVAGGQITQQDIKNLGKQFDKTQVKNLRSLGYTTQSGENKGKLNNKLVDALIKNADNSKGADGIAKLLGLSGDAKSNMFKSGLSREQLDELENIASNTKETVKSLKSIDIDNVGGTSNFEKYANRLLGGNLDSLQGKIASRENMKLFGNFDFKKVASASETTKMTRLLNISGNRESLKNITIELKDKAAIAANNGASKINLFKALNSTEGQQLQKLGVGAFSKMDDANKGVVAAQTMDQILTDESTLKKISSNMVTGRTRAGIGRTAARSGRFISSQVSAKNIGRLAGFGLGAVDPILIGMNIRKASMLQGETKSASTFKGLGATGMVAGGMFGYSKYLQGVEKSNIAKKHSIKKAGMAVVESSADDAGKMAYRETVKRGGNLTAARAARDAAKFNINKLGAKDLFENVTSKIKVPTAKSAFTNSLINPLKLGGVLGAGMVASDIYVDYAKSGKSLRTSTGLYKNKVSNYDSDFIDADTKRQLIAQDEKEAFDNKGKRGIEGLKESSGKAALITGAAATAYAVGSKMVGGKYATIGKGLKFAGGMLGLNAVSTLSGGYFGGAGKLGASGKNRRASIDSAYKSTAFMDGKIKDLESENKVLNYKQRSTGTLSAADEGKLKGNTALLKGLKSSKSTTMGSIAFMNEIYAQDGDNFTGKGDLDKGLAKKQYRSMQNAVKIGAVAGVVTSMAATGGGTGAVLATGLAGGIGAGSTVYSMSEGLGNYAGELFGTEFEQGTEFKDDYKGTTMAKLYNSLSSGKKVPKGKEVSSYLASNNAFINASSEMDVDFQKALEDGDDGKVISDLKIAGATSNLLSQKFMDTLPSVDWEDSAQVETMRSAEVGRLNSQLMPLGNVEGMKKYKELNQNQLMKESIMSNIKGTLSTNKQESNFYSSIENVVNGKLAAIGMRNPIDALTMTEDEYLKDAGYTGDSVTKKKTLSKNAQKEVDDFESYNDENTPFDLKTKEGRAAAVAGNFISESTSNEMDAIDRGELADAGAQKSKENFRAKGVAGIQTLSELSKDENIKDLKKEQSIRKQVDVGMFSSTKQREIENTFGKRDIAIAQIDSMPDIDNLLQSAGIVNEDGSTKTADQLKPEDFKKLQESDAYKLGDFKEVQSALDTLQDTTLALNSTFDASSQSVEKSFTNSLEKAGRAAIAFASGTMDDGEFRKTGASEYRNVKNKIGDLTATGQAKQLEGQSKLDEFKAEVGLTGTDGDGGLLSMEALTNVDMNGRSGLDEVADMGIYSDEQMIKIRSAVGDYEDGTKDKSDAKKYQIDAAKEMGSQAFSMSASGHSAMGLGLDLTSINYKQRSKLRDANISEIQDTMNRYRNTTDPVEKEKIRGVMEKQMKTGHSLGMNNYMIESKVNKGKGNANLYDITAEGVTADIAANRKSSGYMIAMGTSVSPTGENANKILEDRKAAAEEKLTTESKSEYNRLSDAGMDRQEIRDAMAPTSFTAAEAGFVKDGEDAALLEQYKGLKAKGMSREEIGVEMGEDNRTKAIKIQAESIKEKEATMTATKAASGCAADQRNKVCKAGMEMPTKLETAMQAARDMDLNQSPTEVAGVESTKPSLMDSAISTGKMMGAAILGGPMGVSGLTMAGLFGSKDKKESEVAGLGDSVGSAIESGIGSEPEILNTDQIIDNLSDWQPKDLGPIGYDSAADAYVADVQGSGTELQGEVPDLSKGQQELVDAANSTKAASNNLTTATTQQTLTATTPPVNQNQVSPEATTSVTAAKSGADQELDGGSNALPSAKENADRGNGEFYVNGSPQLKGTASTEESFAMYG